MSSEQMGVAAGIGAGVARWIGVALTLVAVIAILWLAATGRLELYVHPRYTVFTVVLALVGGGLAVAALLVGGRDDAHGHEHLQEAEEVPTPRGSGPARPLFTAGRILIVAVSAVALIVLPPATLTAHTAQSRTPAGPGSTGPGSTALSSSTTLVAGSTASFTVKDWAALLRTGDSDAVAGRTARITAYVLPAGGASDEFYAARLLVTCCAVDAQPVAVPVHLEGWRSQFSANSWVEITGRFQQNPDAASSIPTVLVPDRIRKVPEPAKPYVY